MSDASQICRMCLRNGGKLFNLNHFNLKDIYLETTGIQLKNQEYMLPQNSCNICIHLLQKMAIFSKQCQDADDILNKLILNGHVITAESIKHQNVCINVYSNLEIAKQVNWDYLPVWSDTYEDVEVIKSEDDPITNSDAKISRTGTQITSLTSGVSQSVSGTISDTASDHDELVTFFDYKTEVKVEPKEDRKKGRRRRKEKKDGGVVKIKKKKVKPSPSKTAPIAEQKIKIEKDFSPKPEPVDEDYSDNDEKTLAEMVVARPNSVKKRGPAEKVASYSEEIMLTREEQLQEMERRKESENFRTSPYQCRLCFIGYSHQRTYSNHMAKHDPSAGDFECEVCHIRKKHKYTLTHHYNLLHAKRYKCRACPYVARTSTQARLHQRWHNGFMFQCQFCGRTFSHQTSFLSHVRIVHPSEFVCDLCGERFVNQAGVNKHKRAIHGRENPDTDEPNPNGPYCEECDLQFSSEDAFRRHTVTSSRHNLGNSCKICGDVYMIQSELQTHERLCTVLTGKRGNSDRPEKFTDKPERVTCKECGASLSSMNAYRAHHRLKHLGIRQYIPCTDCHLRFPSKARLRYHRRTHTGERPYSCPSCPKRFAMPDLLKLHSRTHSGERPYACPLCAKAFASKAGLNRHNMVHTGLKPYECEMCGKKFSQCKARKHHINTVHMKLPPPYTKRRRGRDVQDMHPTNVI